VDFVKLRKSRLVPLFLTAAFVGLVPLATPAVAAPATVVANLDPVPDGNVAPGALATFSLTITPDSRTLASYTLSPAAGYKIASVGTPTTGSASINGSGQIVVTELSVSPSQTAVLTFSANASCVSGAQDWTLVARDSQNRIYSNGTSDLGTTVDGACDLVFLNQPSNTKAGDLITSGDRQTGGAIQVQLVDDLVTPDPVTHFPVAVTFVLGSDPSDGAAVLTVGTETTINGVATFDDETPTAEGGDGLEINLANVAEFSDYTLVPRGITLTSIMGPASNGFDIWEDATRCNGPNCSLLHDGDEYTVPNGQAGALLSASTFTTNESDIDCAGYSEITGDVVWHEYTGTGAVLVKIHITRQEMKASANNGQARVAVCVGLVDEGELTGEEKWAELGVTADHQDSDDDGFDDIWVGLAPACPNQDPSGSAPCIFRQYGDGMGGSYTEAWIPGGDPPRRT
jgi:hypothetical protein